MHSAHLRKVVLNPVLQKQPPPKIRSLTKVRKDVVIILRIFSRFSARCLIPGGGVVDVGAVEVGEVCAVFVFCFFEFDFEGCQDFLR